MTRLRLVLVFAVTSALCAGGDDPQEGKLRGWAKTLWHNAQFIRYPDQEEACAAIVEQFPRLTPEEQARFWEFVRELDPEAKDAKDWSDLLVHTRLGLTPVNDEIALEISSDGSGTFRRTLNIKQLAASWQAHRVQLGMAEHAAADLAAQVRELAASLTPKRTAGLAPLDQQKDGGDDGVLRLAYRFPSVDSLNKALASTDDVWRQQLKFLKGDGGIRLLQWEEAIPEGTDTGMVGLELVILYGIRKKITLKTDVPVLRTTGRQTGPKETVWEGIAFDFCSFVIMPPCFAAAEFGSRAPPDHPLLQKPEFLPQRPVWPKLKAKENRDPTALFAAEMSFLRSPNPYDRRATLYALIVDKVQKGPDKDPVPFLLKAMAQEPDLRVQLQLHLMLDKAYNRKHDFLDFRHWREQAGK